MSSFNHRRRCIFGAILPVNFIDSVSCDGFCLSLALTRTLSPVTACATSLTGVGIVALRWSLDDVMSSLALVCLVLYCLTLSSVCPEGTADDSKVVLSLHIIRTNVGFITSNHPEVAIISRK